MANMYDFAYGNKLVRLVKEAEHIMEFEKERFVPPKQTPFVSSMRRKRRRNKFEATGNAVSSYWP